MQDQFKQSWNASLEEHSRAINYRMYKSEFKFERYLLELSDFQRTVLARFRLGSSKLPIERGQYQNVIRERRYCNLCENNEVGDEFHLLFQCRNRHVTTLRHSLLPEFCHNRPNSIKFSSLMNMHDAAKLRNLVRYLDACNKLLV